ncbi:unnamed protein product, partial [Amoebophrya sp. A120]
EPAADVQQVQAVPEVDLSDEQEGLVVQNQKSTSSKPNLTTGQLNERSLYDSMLGKGVVGQDKAFENTLQNYVWPTTVLGATSASASGANMIQHWEAEQHLVHVQSDLLRGSCEDNFYSNSASEIQIFMERNLGGQSPDDSGVQQQFRGEDEQLQSWRQCYQHDQQQLFHAQQRQIAHTGYPPTTPGDNYTTAPTDTSQHHPPHCATVVNGVVVYVGNAGPQLFA